MNSRKNLSDIPNKNVSGKKLKKLKKKEDNVKLKRQAAEMQNRLSELVNNACMNKS